MIVRLAFVFVVCSIVVAARAEEPCGTTTSFSVWTFAATDLRNLEDPKVIKWIRDDIENLLSTRACCTVLHRDTVAERARAGKSVVDYKVYGEVDHDASAGVYRVTLIFENQRTLSRKSCATEIHQTKIDVPGERRKTLRSLFGEVISRVLNAKNPLPMVETLEQWEPLVRNVFGAFQREKECFNGLRDACLDIRNHVNEQYDARFYIPLMVVATNRKDSLLSAVRSYYLDEEIDKQLDEILTEIRRFNDNYIIKENDYLRLLYNYYNAEYGGSSESRISEDQVETLRAHVKEQSAERHSEVFRKISEVDSRIRGFVSMLRARSSPCD